MMHKRYWIYEDWQTQEGSGLNGFSCRTDDLKTAERHAAERIASDNDLVVTIFDTHEELTEAFIWSDGAIECSGWAPLIVPYLPEEA